MTTIILYRPELERPTRKAGRYLKGIYLRGGRNTLSAQQYESLKKDEFFVEETKHGVFSVLDNISKGNSEHVKNLRDFTVADGMKVVAMEKDLAVLRQWQSAEGGGRARVKLMNAIARQIRLIESGEL